MNISLFCPNVGAREIISKAFQRSYGPLVENRVYVGQSGPRAKKEAYFGILPKEFGNFIYESSDQDLNVDSFKIISDDRIKILREETNHYDFTNEWNNLGYGPVLNSGPFSINLKLRSKIKCLANLVDSTGLEIPFVHIFKTIDREILWINREAGLADGNDWSLVENFFSEDFPRLLEVPYGFKCAVTMRIDCDEDIKSGRKLFELYKTLDVPFSMAIKTCLPRIEADLELIRDVLNSRGSVVSHSHTHKPYWGGSYETALNDAKRARKEIEVLGGNTDYVVSPFHQNPKYAVEAIREAGHIGFVAGIIHNDPEYLCGRSGAVPFVEKIFTHSQQCMLHGDCYHSTGLDIYKKSFLNHYESGTFFGFLDQPFSNYKYGWNCEEERLNAHEDFLNYLMSFEKVWFASLVDTLDFLYDRYNTKIWIDINGELKWEIPQQRKSKMPLAAFWRGKEIQLS